MSFWKPHHWEDYRFDILKFDGAAGTFSTTGHLEAAKRPRYTLDLYGQGKASLGLHLQSTYAADFLSDVQYAIKVYRDGAYVRGFLVGKDDRGYTQVNQVYDEYIEIVLEPIEKILAWYHCLPDVDDGESVLEVTDLVDDGFKTIVDVVAGQNAYISPVDGDPRVLTCLDVCANKSERAGAVALKPTKQNLFEYLQRYGALYDVDWEVYFTEANLLKFETYYPRRGLDKTETNGVRQPVIFNDAEPATIVSAKRFRQTAGMGNVFIDQTLTYEEKDAASVAAWGRREKVVPVSTEVELQVIAEEQGLKLGASYNIKEHEQCQMIGHYEPGDEVTVSNLHLDISAEDKTIARIEVSFDDEGWEHQNIVFGDPEPDLKDQMKGGGVSKDDPSGPDLGGECYWERDYANNYLYARYSVANNDDAVIIGRKATPSQKLEVYDTGGAFTRYDEGSDQGDVGIESGGIVVIDNLAGKSVSIRHNLVANESAHFNTAGVYVVNAGNFVMQTGAVAAINGTTKLYIAGATGIVQVYNTVQPNAADTIDIGTNTLWFKHVYAQRYYVDAATEYIDLLSAGNIRVVATTALYAYFGGALSLAIAADRLNPGIDNTSDLGLAAFRWKNVYSYAANVAGNITVTGTVDGVDIAAFKTAYDAHDHGGATGLYAQHRHLVDRKASQTDVVDGHSHEYHHLTATGTGSAQFFTTYVAGHAHTIAVP